MRAFLQGHDAHFSQPNPTFMMHNTAGARSRCLFLPHYQSRAPKRRFVFARDPPHWPSTLPKSGLPEVRRRSHETRTPDRDGGPGGILLALCTQPLKPEWDVLSDLSARPPVTVTVPNLRFLRTGYGPCWTRSSVPLEGKLQLALRNVAPTGRPPDAKQRQCQWPGFNASCQWQV